MSKWVVADWIEKLNEVENDLTRREFLKFDNLRDEFENQGDLADGDLQFLENLVERYT